MTSCRIFETDVSKARSWHIKCRPVTVVFRSGRRAPDREILTLEHSGLQLDTQPGTFHWIHVTVFNAWDHSDQLLVPAAIKCADRFLDQGIRLTEGHVHRRDEPHRADAIMRRKRAMPGFCQRGDLSSFREST